MALKKRIINCFNSKAYGYNQAADIQPLVAKNLADRLMSSRAQQILEIGCGTGMLSQYLMQSFPEANLLLTDIAPAMVSACQESLAPNDKVEVVCMDGEALTTPMTFDLIVSSMTMHWFSDIKNSMASIIAKLAPGGRLMFAMLGDHSLTEWRQACKAANVSIPMPKLPSYREIQKTYPDLKLEVVLEKMHYRNAYQFLKTLKAIGAHAAHADHISYSAGVLRRMMRHLDNLFSNDIEISYEIIYGSYENK